MKQHLAQLLVILVLLGTAVAQRSQHDGEWWRSLSDSEQVEFLAGYIDCYANDLGDKNNTFPESWYTYAPRITRYYEQYPGRVKRGATKILFEVRSKRPPKPPKGGETWNEKHWFFTGDYWRGLSTNQQTAFIDGYLSCYREHLASRPKRFSNSAATYPRSISRWFEVEETDPSQINAKHENIAIADALYRFADRDAQNEHGTCSDDGVVSFPLGGWVGYTNTGKSESGMTVECFTNPDEAPIASVQTDATGRFSFPKLKPGKYYLKASKQLPEGWLLNSDAVVAVDKGPHGIACVVAEAQAPQTQ